jgi:regulator of replication initiation timing
VDEAGYRERRSGLQENVLDAANRGREAAAKMNDLSKSAADMRAKAQTLVNERDLLDTQTGKLAKRLKDLSEDTATGWDWIQNNRHTLQLKGNIYGPPILTCSVTDPRYADIVEGQFGGVGDATAITFTNGDDQRLISNKLLGRDGLNLHQVTLRSVNQPLSYYRAPLTKEELQNLGFEGFILDYIEPVLAMLCDSAKLHCTAYASTPLSEEQHENVTRSPISAWITGRSKYRVIRRREYGNASSTRVTTISPAKYFTDQPVDDDDRKRRLDNEIREIKQDMQTLKEQYSELKKEADQRKEEQAQFKSELVSTGRSPSFPWLTPIGIFGRGIQKPTKGKSLLGGTP